MRANGTSVEGRKLVNGELLSVQGIEADGTLRTLDRSGAVKTLRRENQVLELGYAATSYSSQGRTADAVILADAGVKAATHRKEWYVSISRARRKIAVITPDVADLALRITSSGDRMLGLELIPEVEEHVQHNLRWMVHQSLRRAHDLTVQIRERIRL